MPGTSPIQLGSAVSGWTFEAASSVEESASGIQTCTVQALWPIGSTVLSNLPSAGASASVITSYIPSTFLLDYTESGPGVDFIEGTVARVKFKFKRQDPNRSGSVASRLVTTDTILNYQTFIPTQSLLLAGTGVSQNPAPFGFPEPVATVVYNTSSEPSYSDGIYALPGSARASGFPTVAAIIVTYQYIAQAGWTVYLANGDVYGPLARMTTFSFYLTFVADPKGWQLQKVKYSPIANRAFYDVEEQWRIAYYFSSTAFVGTSPSIPPNP